MVLVDTSIWIDHFKKNDSRLVVLLENNEVAIHPFIIGELGCGLFKNRSEIFNLLKALHSLSTLSIEEYLLLVDVHKLYGTGIGFVDIHLLLAALLNQCQLYTRDKRLLSAAQALHVAF